VKTCDILKTCDIVRMTGLSRAQIAREAAKGEVPGASRSDGLHWEFRNTAELHSWVKWRANNAGRKPKPRKKTSCAAEREGNPIPSRKTRGPLKQAHHFSPAIAGDLDLETVQELTALDSVGWEMSGRYLAHKLLKNQLAIGDWLAHGEDRFAQRGKLDSFHEKACNITGLDKRVLKDLGAVVRKITPEVRQTALKNLFSWGHLRIFSKLPDDDQREWLNVLAEATKTQKVTL
jgi:hypothetical protein